MGKKGKILRNPISPDLVGTFAKISQSYKEYHSEKRTDHERNVEKEDNEMLYESFCYGSGSDVEDSDPVDDKDKNQGVYESFQDGSQAHSTIADDDEKIVNDENNKTSIVPDHVVLKSGIIPEPEKVVQSPITRAPRLIQKTFIPSPIISEQRFTNPLEVSQTRVITDTPLHSHPSISEQRSMNQTVIPQLIPVSHQIPLPPSYIPTPLSKFQLPSGSSNTIVTTEKELMELLESWYWSGYYTGMQAEKKGVGQKM